MTEPFPARRAGVAAALPEEVDGLVVAGGPTLRYLTGYAFDAKAHGLDSPCPFALSAGGAAGLCVPAAEAPRARDSLAEVSVHPYGGPGPDAGTAVSAMLRDLAIAGPVGVVPRSLRLLEWRLIEAALGGTDPVDVTGTVDDVRSRKAPEEIAALREAASITADALRGTVGAMAPGMTEREIHVALQRRVLGSGAEAYAVGIVTSGERTARNYVDTSDRPVDAGDLVMIDTGAVYGGYYADVTRTVAVGEPPAELSTIHGVVLAANRAAREAATPGMTAGDLDAVAREVIADAGYGGAFTTTLGHGIGLEAHEPPALAPGNDRVLEAGNAFTIEPGVYVEGLGGIRIEDMAVLTGDGCEVLTDLDRGLTWD